LAGAETEGQDMGQRFALLLAVAAAQVSGPHQAQAPPGQIQAEPEAWAAAPGPAVGTAVPAFEARDQDGRLRRFETLRGTNGLLLNFNRSAVW
jgi:hypothetical protein